MRALRGILRDGDVFLDLGAHNRAAKTCARMAGIDPEMTQRPGVVLPRDTGKWIKWSARQEVCQPDCETWILHLNGALGAESFEDNG
ncbi:MAG TPA: hypothetical protein VE778_03650 [Candidatus Bathyarchaeia archaeon]|jgi:hypothetical protein|nr:hypothetical protein [Candidatus Bathyarchaeia archaeon]